MMVVRGFSDWKNIRPELADRSIGFVPTMGALHAGHTSLFVRSSLENQLTVASIYVNPTQFDNPEDLAKYPQQLEQDLEKCQKSKVDFVILPTYEELYADQFRYRVRETDFSQQLCGAHRPGHF